MSENLSRKSSRFGFFFLTTASLLCVANMAISCSAEAATKKKQPKSAYEETRFVANKDSYNAAAKDEKMINAWGIAIRPAGAGGHFWVTGKDVSFEYVGDVRASADEKLRTLHTDNLKYVTLPVGGDDKFATGVVYSDSKDGFVITQEVQGAEPVTAPAKFLFASDGGIISAWTERKKADGSFDRSASAVKVIDASGSGSQFFGLAISHDYKYLYAADFGMDPGIRVFDASFKPVAVNFDTPFDLNKNGKVDPTEYAPFNIQALTTPKGERHIFVTYAKTRRCPPEEVKKDACKPSQLFAGEEDTSKPGFGRIAEFTESGKLVAIWQDGGRLSAPWGIAYAPENFGTLSNMLLVGNFGDGTIAAYNPKTRHYVDVVRSKDGKPLKVDKLWGLLFGNGESLGDKNALYYAAGPDDEKDGLFGSIRLVKEDPPK